MEDQKFHMPLLGDEFPEMTVQTTHGEMTLPKDFKGQWWVLFSHPADFTPVCTTEFVGFQNRMEDFKALNTALVGMSVDQIFSHIKWVQWIKEALDIDIEFPVIAANDTIANKLGMLHPGKGTNTVRAVFIIDPKGNVRLIMYYPQEIGRNMDEIVRAVKALQVSETQGAVPASWPHNELIGDRIIVSPAKDIKTAEARLKDESLECYDWWFCHKPLKK